MREVQAQKLIVDAVRNNGGMAHKLSNRFLVGVSDLLIKLPYHPAMLVEVKLTQLGAKSEAEKVNLDVTKLQEKFLCDYSTAGMPAGVVSFIEYGSKGILRMCIASFSIDSLLESGFDVPVPDHVSIGEYKTRDDLIIRVLEELHV